MRMLKNKSPKRESCGTPERMEKRKTSSLGMEQREIRMKWLWNQVM
jgi:hypothetical protein